MASGDVVGAILSSIPTAGDRADPGIRQSGASTTGGAENLPVINFNDSTPDEHWDFMLAIEGYAAGGLTIELVWTRASGTAASNVRWGVALRRLSNAAEDIDNAHTYDFNEITAAASTTLGFLDYDTVTFTNGADMDSLADGERAVMRIRREASDGTNDTLTGDAQLLWPLIVIRET